MVADNGLVPLASVTTTVAAVMTDAILSARIFKKSL
jgi:hypothetical protein